jgi:rod shape-determining protein MreC
MPLGTLERDAPSLFRQGPSALSRLVFFCALALFLMVADARFGLTQPLRAAVSAVLQPLQWLALQPVQAVRQAADYVESRNTAQQVEAAAKRLLVQQSLKANQVDQLMLENQRLRDLLALRQRVDTPARAAEVLYDAPDPYTRRVVIDQGLTQGIEPGSPVLDESGVLGQVTRVHPFLSEVTLLVDRDQAIPVLNTRTGVRSVAYGDPTGPAGGGLELRFTPTSADVQEGDLLTTSGVDGVYPPGLPVAKVDRVERRVDSAFARIHGAPLAQTQGARHVLVLKPGAAELPQRPASHLPATAASGAAGKKGARK